jgi:hypothetical protein
MMARTKKLKKAKKASAGVKCAGCNRMSSAPAEDGQCLWYCPPCNQMYWMGMQDGLNTLPPQNAAGTHVTAAVVSAVVVEKKKAGRAKMLFCCKEPGCRQAEAQHNFGSGYHLKQHTKNAHEEPRFGPCRRCGTKFKSLAGFNNHMEKQPDCVQVDPEVMYALTQVAPLVPATAPATAEDETPDSDGPY